MNSMISGISSLLSTGSRVMSNVVPYQLPTLPSFITTNPVASLLFSLSPLILILLGVGVFFAGKLAKFVGVVIVIIGVIGLFFPYLLKVI